MFQDPLTNTAFIIFAALCPMLIAVVKQQGWSSQVNSLVALGCYIVIGMLGALLSGYAFTLENVVPMITVGTVVGSAAYNLFWAQLGSPSIDARITAATSFVK
jgi:hypothetical protein